MMPVAATPFNLMPPKIFAAMEFVRFAECLRNPPPMFDGTRIEPRELSDQEQPVYDAALKTLLAYFKTPEPPVAPPWSPLLQGGDDGPTTRVPITQ